MFNDNVLFKDDFVTNSQWFNVQINGIDASIIKADIKLSNSRIILFSTNESMRLLAKGWSISLDGTFKICPQLLGQVLIVLSEVTENFYVPVAFAYLPGKSEEIYTTLFTSIICILKELGFSFQPILLCVILSLD